MFFVEKKRKAFAVQIWDINFWKFNEKLTNDVVSFEQPGPELWSCGEARRWG